MVSDDRSPINERTWFKTEDAHAFLVYGPITFGHSQLKVTVTPGIPEEDSFAKSAIWIAECIASLRTTLTVIDLAQWPALASYTETSGHYVKTLVLKASANESLDSYKVHLVPCFSSHIEAAGHLLGTRLPEVKEQAGGLLYWVGMREDIVDRDTLPKPSSKSWDQIVAFNLVDLAVQLRRKRKSDQKLQGILRMPAPPTLNLSKGQAEAKHPRC